MTDKINGADPEENAAHVIDMLPGLIGALDEAIKDRIGERMPFVLVVFGGDAGFHATNLPTGGEAKRALVGYVAAVAAEDPELRATIARAMGD